MWVQVQHLQQRPGAALPCSDDDGSREALLGGVVGGGGGLQRGAEAPGAQVPQAHGELSLQQQEQQQGEQQRPQHGAAHTCASGARPSRQQEASGRRPADDNLRGMTKEKEVTVPSAPPRVTMKNNDKVLFSGRNLELKSNITLIF